MSGAPYTVGQELWFESAVRYRTSGPVVVETVGRKWVKLVGHHNGRFDIETGRFDSGGSGCSPGDIWPTREAAEAEKSRQREWRNLVDRLRGRWEAPRHLTTKQIREAARLLLNSPTRPDGAAGTAGEAGR